MPSCAACTWSALTSSPPRSGNCQRIEEQIRLFSRQLEQLATIPGVGQATAEVIIAETGTDMIRFRTAGHLVS
ncbi:MAG: IS110 family transposase [Actinomycetota bacterium]|nr:IS110 family transposase [Actinomycetota bacterium]